MTGPGDGERFVGWRKLFAEVKVSSLTGGGCGEQNIMCEKTKGEEVIQLSCLVSGSLLSWQLVSGRVTESAAADTTLAAVDTSGGVALLRDKIFHFYFFPN